jgi:hypothetical protein
MVAGRLADAGQDLAGERAGVRERAVERGEGSVGGRQRACELAERRADVVLLVGEDRERPVEVLDVLLQDVLVRPRAA